MFWMIEPDLACIYVGYHVSYYKFFTPIQIISGNNPNGVNNSNLNISKFADFLMTVCPIALTLKLFSLTNSSL